MLRNRAITIICISLIGVSAIVVFDRVRDNGSAPVAQEHHSSLHQAPAMEQPGVSTRRTKSMSEMKKAPIEQRAVSTFAKINPLVRIDGGLLSVRAHDAPLDKLLADISERSGIAIYSEAANQSVSIVFRDLPLEGGLKRILEDQDIFFLYGAGGASRMPTALWIYPRGRGREMVPVPPESWASTAELEQALSSDSNAAARMRAVEAVIERKGAESMDSVLYALNDINEQVRYSAVSGALTLGLRLPDGTLENLAQYDRSHFVRMLALKAIAEAPGADEVQARSMAEAALADPHPDVRAQARDVLVTLKQADRPQGLSETANLYRRLLAK